jgi:hypothetical protein
MASSIRPSSVGAISRSPLKAADESSVGDGEFAIAMAARRDARAAKGRGKGGDEGTKKPPICLVNAVFGAGICLHAEKCGCRHGFYTDAEVLAALRSAPPGSFRALAAAAHDREAALRDIHGGTRVTSAQRMSIHVNGTSGYGGGISLPKAWDAK